MVSLHWKSNSHSRVFRNIEAATTAWFNNPPKLPGGAKPAASAAVNKSNAVAVFKKFLTGSEKEWDADMLEAFYKELNVNMYEDPVVFMVAYKMGCERNGVVTEAEFLKGAEACGGCDSIDKWAKAIPNLRNQVEKNKDCYTFIYNYSLDWENSVKTLVIEDAIAIWKAILPKFGYKAGYLDDWYKFLEKKKASGKLNVVSLDNWKMFWELGFACGFQLDQAEDDGCWPVVIEEFMSEQGHW